MPPVVIVTTTDRAKAVLNLLEHAWVGDESGRLVLAFCADVDQALHVTAPLTFESEHAVHGEQRAFDELKFDGGLR